MLTRFTALNGENYFLWTTIDTAADNGGAFSMVITNISNVWSRTNLDIHMKPTSRKDEKTGDYFATLQNAFEIRESFEYDILTVSSHITFTIKERISSSSTTTALLAKIDIPIAINPCEQLVGLFESLVVVMSCKNRQIIDLRRECNDRGFAVSDLRREVDDFVGFKDKFQDQILRKMCILLNTKKRRIAELRDLAPDSAAMVSEDVSAASTHHGTGFQKRGKDTVSADNESATDGASKKKHNRGHDKRIQSSTKAPSFLLTQSAVEIDGDGVDDMLSQILDAEADSDQASSKELKYRTEGISADSPSKALSATADALQRKLSSIPRTTEVEDNELKLRCKQPSNFNSSTPSSACEIESRYSDCTKPLVATTGTSSSHSSHRASNTALKSSMGSIATAKPAPAAKKRGLLGRIMDSDDDDDGLASNLV